MHQDNVFCPFLGQDLTEVIHTPIEKVVAILIEQFGEPAYTAFYPEHTVDTPLAGITTTAWMKTANCVGINVRTIDSFWNIIPYAFSLPKAQQAIHILPIWEPGVVASLYGMSSWNINPEFYSPALSLVFPHLNTVEKQLKVVINILHLTGRVVGMDVVPHTDRYSEQVLANPQYFEWIQRKDDKIVRHEGDLYENAAQLIFEAFLQLGCGVPGWTMPQTAAEFYGEWPEEARLLALFGPYSNYSARLQRRKVIIQWLYDHGFETVPATMGPPYRGIEVDPNPDASVYDDEGRLWRDYRITRPQAMSRVFGPLARYRLYESKNNNADWELDFEQPVTGAWNYVCRHYNQIAKYYNFDFMRGDMSHVQMRPGGVPAQTDAWYDILGAVKTAVLKEKPWFGYFAESFMAPPGEMAYGDESDHLEASLADSTLGDLQSEPVGTSFFVKEFARYVDTLERRKFAPNFTILTADKDDPRFDAFYLKGNEIRHFIALFLPVMPSYMAMGFECRDPHPQPFPNEYYSKLYVFQLREGPKGTKGKYRWGNNHELYQNLVAQRQLSNEIGALITPESFEWVAKPDPDGVRKHVGWRTGKYLFYANLDTEKESAPIELNADFGVLQIIFSTIPHKNEDFRIKNGKIMMLPGEGLVLSVP